MNGAVILAGGKGSRYKKRKQFELIDGIEMWKYVYDKTVQVVDKKHIVVVGVDTVGGETRSKSVAIGLEALQDECQRVIILEAARPLVTVAQIIKLLEDESKSTTYAMPLVNTVIGRDGRYYNRDNFYNLLTPQAFDFQMLRNAYRTGKYIDTTDETIVMSEEYGISPHFIVEGENLIKVTYQRDMAVVRQLLKQQEE